MPIYWERPEIAQCIGGISWVVENSYHPVDGGEGDNIEQNHHIACNKSSTAQINDKTCHKQIQCGNLSWISIFRKYLLFQWISVQAAWDCVQRRHPEIHIVSFKSLWSTCKVDQHLIHQLSSHFHNN